MNFISYAILSVVISLSLVSHSESLPANTIKTPLQICAEKKLKEFRKRTLVSIADEPIYLDKFKQECAKDKLISNQEQQALDAAKAAEKDKKVVTAPTKPASADATSAANSNPPKPATSPAPSSSSSGGGQVVFGGCGNAQQCAASMEDAYKVKYTWSSPGLQAYLGELWGNNFNYAYSLGGTFEQPESVCNEKNQGEIIAFDMGTEVKPIACMSNQATQEELKKMAEKIKNVKIETLPTVVAVKKAKYEWKVIVEEAKLEEGQMRFCTGAGSCSSDSVGKVFNEGNGCAVFKCIRIDGGPVKTVKKEEKKDEKKADPVAENQPVAPREPAQQQPAQQPPQQIYQGFDPQRDGAAGP